VEGAWEGASTATDAGPVAAVSARASSTALLLQRSTPSGTSLAHASVNLDCKRSPIVHPSTAMDGTHTVLLSEVVLDSWGTCSAARLVRVVRTRVPTGVHGARNSSRRLNHGSISHAPKDKNTRDRHLFAHTPFPAHVALLAPHLKRILTPSTCLRRWRCRRTSSCRARRRRSRC
jgi:hypothetical protein